MLVVVGDQCFLALIDHDRLVIDEDLIVAGHVKTVARGISQYEVVWVDGDVTVELPLAETRLTCVSTGDDDDH